MFSDTIHNHISDIAFNFVALHTIQHMTTNMQYTPNPFNYNYESEKMKSLPGCYLDVCVCLSFDNDCEHESFGEILGLIIVLMSFVRVKM